MTVMNIMQLLLARPDKRDTFRNLYITKFSVIYFTITVVIYFTITTVIVKYMKKKLDLTKPRYSKQILLVPWPFVFSRFHCILLLLGVKKIVCYTATISL